ncbi:MAG: hypothetical protein U9R27_08620 [Campylobacterota bacterium]|nr:hypothetical protein [Campylobacterota bacterium]
MKRVILACIVIGLISGCESREEIERAKQAELFKEEQMEKVRLEAKAKAQKEQKEAQEAAKKAQLAAQEAQKPSMLNNFGVSMEEGKLIIDTNKAKEFLGQVKKNLDGVDKEIKSGNVTMMQSAGIEVTNDTVSIDLNESKTFFDKWGKKMEGLAKEFDAFAKSLNSNELNNTKEVK